jgi:hypothetical protein
MNIDFTTLLKLWLILSIIFWARPFFTHHWRGPLVWWVVLCVVYWAIPVAGWVATRYLRRCS